MTNIGKNKEDITIHGNNIDIETNDNSFNVNNLCIGNTCLDMTQEKNQTLPKGQGEIGQCTNDDCYYCTCNNGQPAGKGTCIKKKSDSDTEQCKSCKKGYQLNTQKKCVLCTSTTYNDKSLNAGDCISCSALRSCGSGNYRDSCGGTSSGSCKKCDICPTGKHRINCSGLSAGSCTPNTCKCDNGTPVKGTACTAHNANICSDCNGDGDYYKSGNKCVACKACPPGQYRTNCNNTSSGRCNQNTCKCNNGTKAKGTTCTTHNANICTHCNGGYRKSGNFCYKNTCKCNNGGAAKGTACTKHNTNICDRCDAGYYLSGTECKVCKSKGCPTNNYRAGWSCSGGATCKKKTDCGSLGIRTDATSTSDNVCRSWQPAGNWTTLYKEDNRGWGKYQSAWIESRKNNKTYAYAVHDNKVVWYEDHGYNNNQMRAPGNSAWMSQNSTTKRRYGGGTLIYSGDDFDCTQHGRRHAANNRTYYENDPNKKNNGICNDWGWSDTNTHYRQLQYQEQELK